MCTHFRGEENVSTDELIATLRVRRTSLVGGGIFLAFFLTSQHAWARAPQGIQSPQEKQATQTSPTQQASLAQQDSPAQQTSRTQQTEQGPQTQQSAGTLPAPQVSPPAQKDLTQVSIENLMNMEVTSVSKKEQKLSQVAAAIFVITQEDIRSSGALNIPDLLRMVPGLDVAQINANTWAITARGFNAEFSNELLVMVDGRNIYTETFGGVYWDVLNAPLEDIERIEVIRGPGGTSWGANAVNGVINIITKKASETRGALVVAGGGNLDQGFGTAQYGGSLGKSTDYRVYSQYFNQDHMPDPTGQNGGDGWHILQGGFRTDSALSSKDTLMVEGSLYTGEEGDPSVLFPSVLSPSLVNADLQVSVSGGSLQSAWNHVFSARSDTTLLISYDAYQRNNNLREGRKTFNLDFQNHIAWGKRQDFVWGLGYEDSASHSDGNLVITLNPADLTTQVFSGFVQDEIALVPDRFYLTVGTKLAHNYYTGFNYMPSARATYALGAHDMLWAAVSRAVRTPAETDTAVRINFAGIPGPGGVPALVSLIGNPNFQDENLIAYEVGYRTTVLDRLSIDIAAYYNDYSNQETAEPAAPFFEPTPLPAHFVFPTEYENLMHGETHGLEIAANWKITDRWIIRPGYDFERIHMHTSPSSQDTQTALETEGSSPDVQAQLRSHVDLSGTLKWDTSVYFIDRLTAQDVPSYTRLDSGLTWRWKEGISLSLVGQNLLRDHHLEFADFSGATRSTLVKRSAYAKIAWRF
jgi:iron complex outermembrane receptor protein